MGNTPSRTPPEGSDGVVVLDGSTEIIRNVDMCSFHSIVVTQAFARNKDKWIEWRMTKRSFSLVMRDCLDIHISKESVKLLPFVYVHTNIYLFVESPDHGRRVQTAIILACKTPESVVLVSSCAPFE